MRVLALVTEVLGSNTWGDVLELGCADGVFTVDLASRSNRVSAFDISPVACVRARTRSSGLENVWIEQRDIDSTRINGLYDVVFAMDILETIRGIGKLAKIAKQIAAVLRPNGLFVLSDCRAPELVRSTLWSRLVADGDQIARFFEESRDFRLIHREYHPESGNDVPPEYYAHVMALYERVATE